MEKDEGEVDVGEGWSNSGKGRVMTMEDVRIAGLRVEGNVVLVPDRSQSEKKESEERDGN